ncbi:MAG: glycosyltransferase family 4 protein [Akkermansiaceae bacterium]
MKITILTAGTGSYYCGACMRDNALVKGLRSRGHDAHLVPMYLPLQLDEEKTKSDEATPVFFGGINVYLQQKYRLLRSLPAWVDRLFNGNGLLRAVAKRSHLTDAHEQGEMTHIMLKLEESHLGKEIEKLESWLEGDGKPDVILLSNALLGGMVSELQRRLGVPIVCAFQGEDVFLDGLPEPWKTKCWEEMATCVKRADCLVTSSRFYAQMMEKNLGVTGIEVIPNGIDLEGYEQGIPQNIIGYFARMNQDKGLGLLIDAFIHLRQDPEIQTSLKIGGTVSGADESYLSLLKEKIAMAGLSEEVSWHENVSHEEKAAFLKRLGIFSVPAIYPEGFGLYLIEAMACGIPVVMPRASAFPEIIEPYECGLLVEPENPAALAAAWAELLADEPRRISMGKKGRRAVEDRYHVGAMSESYEKLFRKVVNQ